MSDKVMIDMAISERDRTGFSVLWNKNNNSLSYSNNEGVMNVEIRKKFEKIFFTPKRFENGKAVYGERKEVETIKEKGKVAYYEQDVFTALPDDFKKITEDYQYNRKTIGLDKAKECKFKEETR